jgi:DNA polymerase-3 subunit delta'
MAWNRIVAHERVKKILQRAIIDNRIPHAYCFIGTEGIGKDATALEFAKTVNCLNPKINGNQIDACGECRSCQQAENFIHPNIQYIFSLPAGKTDSKDDAPINKLSDEQLNEIKEQLAAKAHNPYHQIAITNATQIRIASVRELKRNLSLSASTGGRRCVIVSRAEELTTEAANAFLKTLEEPHDNITLILTTSSPEKILQTILSRCQQIKFSPVAEEGIISYLIDNKGLEQHHARTVAAFARGSISGAIDYLGEDVLSLRDEAVDLLRTSLKKKVFRAELIEKIENTLKSKDKKKLGKLLAMLSYWLKDAYLLSFNGNKDGIVNIDQLEVIQKFNQNFDARAIPEITANIDKSINLISRNVNQSLILISLFLEIRQNFIANTH